jgi:hypothetical protein
MLMPWITILLVAMISAGALPARAQTAAPPANAAAEPDKDTLDAARALTRVLFSDENQVMPPSDSRAGDEKDPMGFQALRRAQDKWQKMYAPASPEAARRRDELVAKFLARRFSAAEMREIAAFVDRNLLEKMEEAIHASARATIEKCFLNPTFDIGAPPPVDPEKRELIYKLADVRDATGSSLPILACGDVLAEQAWSQMSVDELRAVVAFNESAAGMKWAALLARLRQ